MNGAICRKKATVLHPVCAPYVGGPSSEMLHVCLRLPMSQPYPQDSTSCSSKFNEICLSSSPDCFSSKSESQASQVKESVEVRQRTRPCEHLALPCCSGYEIRQVTGEKLVPPSDNRLHVCVIDALLVATTSTRVSFWGHRRESKLYPRHSASSEGCFAGPQGARASMQ